MLQDMTRRFLESRSPVEALRKQVDTGAGFDREVWRQAAELGWIAQFVPEENGGIAEELGRVVFSGLFLSSCSVAHAVARSGPAAQREAHLPGLAPQLAKTVEGSKWRFKTLGDF